MSLDAVRFRRRQLLHQQEVLGARMDDLAVEIALARQQGHSKVELKYASGYSLHILSRMLERGQMLLERRER